MHDEAPCFLFRDIIKVFPDLAHDIMSKCHAKQNFRLLEDNYCVQASKETSDTSNRRNTGDSLLMTGGEGEVNALVWCISHSGCLFN